MPPGAGRGGAPSGCNFEKNSKLSTRGGQKIKVIDTIPKILKIKGQVNPPPPLRLRTRPFSGHAP